MPTSDKTRFQNTPAHPHITRPVAAAEGAGKHPLTEGDLKKKDLKTFNTNTQMGQIASDPMLREELKQEAAARLIQFAFRTRRALRGNAPDEKTKVLKAKVSNFVKDELSLFDQTMQEVHDFASATSAMTAGTRWASNSNIVTQPQNSTMVRTQADTLNTAYKSDLWPDERAFVSRLMKLAPDVQGSFYFNADHEQIILDGGFLLSHHVREERWGAGETKTPEKDVVELGNHNHVFFFLEHKDQPFKRTRFAQPSVDTGKAQVPGQDDLSTGDERRISVPLVQLMKKGTWAMARDFLGDDKTQANYNGLSTIPDALNFLDGGTDSNPLKRAQYLLCGLGLTAIQRMRSMSDQAARKAMLGAQDEMLLDVVTRQVLSPQLMVPGGVSLHTPGVTIDRAEPGKPFSERKKYDESARLDEKKVDER